MDISILLPTRERPDLVRRMLDSLIGTASRPERIEVILYADDDDFTSQAITHDGVALRKLTAPRQRMGAITRACYAACRGQYIQLANDDIIYRTLRWDDQVLEAFGEFGDDVALVWGNYLHSGMPAHPFLSRTVCDVVGKICPAEYDREFIDTHLYDIFRLLRQQGHNRMRYLPEVIVEHCHVFAGKMAPDATFQKKHYAHDERTYLGWADERMLCALDLAAHIARCEQRIRVAA